MALELLDPGTAGDDNSGTPLPEAANIINRRILATDRQSFLTEHALGTAGKLVIGGWGDSMWGYGALPSWGGLIATARMLVYNADVLVHTSGPDNGGHNYAVGGTNTQYMLDVQLPKIRAAYEAGTLPPVMWGSGLQNDDLLNPGNAEAAFLRVTAFWEALLAMGRIVVSMGVWPKNAIGQGTQDGFARHYLEQKLMNWAAKRRGMIYIPILDLLKSGSPAEEAAGNVYYKGAVGGVGGASNDGIHCAVYGAWLLRERVAMALRRISAVALPPVHDAVDYDETRNPWGNYLGLAGRMQGSGGLINGVASAAMPAGTELIYDATKGITITPTLTPADPLPLYLTATGSASAKVEWAVRIVSKKRVGEDTLFSLWGEAKWVDARNWAGIAAGDCRVGLPNNAIIIPFGGCGSTGDGHIMPHVSNEFITFHDMQPSGFRNEYARDVRYGVSGAFLPGFDPTGGVKIGRQGLFKTTNSF